jgi:stage V sporulation protein SpoVS
MRTYGSRGSRATVAYALIPLALLTMLALAACGGSSTTSGLSEGAAPDAAAQEDSALLAWPEADAAMRQVADDAILSSVGTGGLALADVPHSWSFAFFSASKNALYLVSVEDGTAQPPRKWLEAKANTEVRTAVDIEEVQVGAAEAVVMAREFGEKSGVVPKNVMVSGAFAEVEAPGGADTGIKLGVWTVTFASGTDLADALKFEVDMMSGAVTAVEE